MASRSTRVRSRTAGVRRPPSPARRAPGGVLAGYRVEVTLVSAGVAVAAGVTRLVSWRWGAAAAVALGALVLILPASRHQLHRALRRSRDTRRLLQLLAVLAPGGWSGPVQVTGWTPTPTGATQVELVLPPGACRADLVRDADRLAAGLHLWAVRVAAGGSDAARVRLTLLARDPLAGAGTAAPWAGATAMDLWEGVPLGVSEDGEAWVVDLVEHSVLVGGEPGAGKSTALGLVTAAAALDPRVGLWCLDGKDVELACWTPRSRGHAGADLPAAIAVLTRLRRVLDGRYQELLATGARKQPPGAPLEVLVIDELAWYTSSATRSDRDEFTERLRDLLARGRAAGIIVVAATQKPASDLLPTSLRDLFGYRLALRCTTPAASDTILGAGWATAGFSATTIDPATRGVGWWLAEGGVPPRVRCHRLDDATLAAIATRSSAFARDPGAGAGAGDTDVIVAGSGRSGPVGREVPGAGEPAPEGTAAAMLDDAAPALADGTPAGTLDAPGGAR